MEDRTLAVGGVLAGRYDRSLDGMSKLLAGREVEPWQAVDLRVRARQANQAVREREAAAVPTVTTTSVPHHGGMREVTEVLGYINLPCEARRVLVVTGPRSTWRTVMSMPVVRRA